MGWWTDPEDKYDEEHYDNIALERTITSADFLRWVHQRLCKRYDNSPQMGYMHRLRTLIKRIDDMEKLNDL